MCFCVGNFNNKIFLIVIFILLETRKVAMESNKFEGEIFLKDGVGGRGAVGEVLKHTLWNIIILGFWIFHLNNHQQYTSIISVIQYERQNLKWCPIIFRGWVEPINMMSYQSYDYVTLYGQRQIILGGPDQFRWDHKVSPFSGWWQKRSDLEEETKYPLVNFRCRPWKCRSLARS